MENDTNFSFLLLEVQMSHLLSLRQKIRGHLGSSEATAGLRRGKNQHHPLMVMLKAHKQTLKLISKDVPPATQPKVRIPASPRTTYKTKDFSS